MMGPGHLGTRQMSIHDNRLSSLHSFPHSFVRNHLLPTVPLLRFDLVALGYSSSRDSLRLIRVGGGPTPQCRRRRCPRRLLGGRAACALPPARRRRLPKFTPPFRWRRYCPACQTATHGIPPPSPTGGGGTTPPPSRQPAAPLSPGPPARGRWRCVSYPTGSAFSSLQ